MFRELSAGAPRNLLAVLGIARFPTASAQFVAQFITFSPVFCKPCPCPCLSQLRDLGRKRRRLFFNDQHAVDAIPPIQPCICRRGVHFILIHRAIRFANRFKQKPERRRNVQVVIERFFELVVRISLTAVLSHARLSLRERGG